jgi:HrpA-like RNA helicase
MNIRDVESFPFPTPPSLLSLKKAQQMLINLGALRSHAVRSLSSIDLLTNISTYKTILDETMRTMEEEKRFDHRSASSAASSSGKHQKSSNISELVKNVLASQNNGSVITELGAFMAKFPVNPRFAKMVILAYQMGRDGDHPDPKNSRILQLTIGLVCCLSEKSPFLRQGTSGATDDFNDSDDSGADVSDDEGTLMLYLMKYAFMVAS